MILSYLAYWLYPYTA